MPGVPVDRVESASGGTVQVVSAGEVSKFDVAILASGAWLSRLGKSAGVRLPLAAGRGYSFTVAAAAPPGRRRIDAIVRSARDYLEGVD